MTINQAIEQAKREVSMYRQGRGWIVSQWSEHHRAWWTSCEMGFSHAVQNCKVHKIDAALQLLGWSAEDSNGAAMEAEGRFEDVVREVVALKQSA